MDFKAIYKILLIKRDLKQQSIADKLNQARGNLSNYIAKADRLTDIKRLADAAGYDVNVIFTNRDSGEATEWQP